MSTGMEFDGVANYVTTPSPTISAFEAAQKRIVDHLQERVMTELFRLDDAHFGWDSGHRTMIQCQACGRIRYLDTQFGNMNARLCTHYGAKQHYMTEVFPENVERQSRSIVERLAE